MKYLKIVFIFLLVNSLLFGELKYEDINKNHWAYSSIEELVNKGIIKQDTFNFDGEKTITRYDFAVILANAINKIDMDKASKKELKVLKSLVIDFSNELNDLGFNTEKFYNELQNTEKKIDDLRNELNKTNLEMKLLEKRIKILEKELGI